MNAYGVLKFQNSESRPRFIIQEINNHKANTTKLYLRGVVVNMAHNVRFFKDFADFRYLASPAFAEMTAIFPKFCRFYIV